MDNPIWPLTLNTPNPLCKVVDKALYIKHLEERISALGKEAQKNSDNYIKNNTKLVLEITALQKLIDTVKNNE